MVDKIAGGNEKR
jgi:hypothetical protein